MEKTKKSFKFGNKLLQLAYSNNFLFGINLKFRSSLFQELALAFFIIFPSKKTFNGNVTTEILPLFHVSKILGTITLTQIHTLLIAKLYFSSKYYFS